MSPAITNSATNNIANTLEAIVRRFAPKEAAALAFTRETRLADDAGIDSPRMIDLVLGVEDAFGITVDDACLDRVKTFGQLVDMVREQTAEAA
jgi:acyl carrier protein